MENKLRTIMYSQIAIVVLVCICLFGLFFSTSTTDNALGGRNHNTMEDFSEGISVDGTTVIDGSGNFAGAVSGTTISGTTISGTTGSFSSTLAVTATTTLTGNLDANGTFNALGDAATSTAQIGKANNAGCIILGDSAGGASVVYIVASGGTITASTTKPAGCQTAR
jgi:hypothetical protein